MVRLAIAVGAALAGCGEIDTFSGDPYPISYVSRAGAVTVEVLAPGESPRAAVLEILSPLTVFDNGAATAPRRRETTFDLLGRTSSGTTVSRARFTGPVVEIHPCAMDACSVGDPAAPFPVTATVGADLLSGDALRFDFAAQQLFVLPDIAGSPQVRTELCDGVFIEPFQGSGTLLLEGAEVTFTSHRTVVESCIAPDTEQLTPPGKRGGDALFVLATGLGPNLMTEATYQRFRDASLTAVPELATLPAATAQLLTGPITGRLAVVPRVSLVGTDPQEPRGPCRETWASVFLETADNREVCLPNVECPCRARDRACRAPSVVMLDPVAGVPFIVVPDTTPLIQDLRAELRPVVGEIDGVLGTDMFAGIQLDVDYPNQRLLWRCIATEGCAVRPQFTGMNGQQDFTQCLVEDG